MFFVLKKTKRKRRSLSTNRKRYLEYKEISRKIVHERVTYFSNYYNVSVNRIAIRNSRSRWGSCSKKGNLNFNYKIALLTQELIDYVIVHELCHLLEFNHSPNFWAHVSRAVPNHKFLRKELHIISRMLR